MRRSIFLFTVFILISIFLTALFSAIAEERMTLTTYYPTPYGVYKDLKTGTLKLDNLGVGSAYENENVTDGYVLISGRLGIGKSNPAYELDVAGDTNINGNLFTEDIFASGISGIGATNPAYELNVAGNVNVSGTLTTNAMDLNILLADMLGIGTDTPSFPLDVVGDTNVEGDISGGNDLTVLGSVGIGTASPAYDLDVAGDANIDGTLYTDVLDLNVLFADTVGIGTTAPQYPLDVVGNAGISEDLTLGGMLIGKTYQRFYANVLYSEVAVIKNMGNWDLCWLSKYKIDNVESCSGGGPEAECIVYPAGAIGKWSIDAGATRQSWVLRADITNCDGDDMCVFCEGTCMNFEHVEIATSPTPICGANGCETELGEDCDTCPADCGSCWSGICNWNGICEQWLGEDCGCIPDCDYLCSLECGDSSCDAGIGETCDSCPADCGSCLPGPVCGENGCEAALGETCATCPGDCGSCCGNGTCQAIYGETCATCPGDCTCPPCGDTICDTANGENCNNCPGDCTDCCGDTICDDSAGEACDNCEEDCGPCGPPAPCNNDSICDPGEECGCPSCDYLCFT